eukprot:CAMPEP_0174870554 /NCGR_PEP_ID=MMETSP1114-20130205/69888_1 /TAXON_ID=312471 /ORGANISM="Neobodo designis, Strain CCAP 1951/1" /LENGTH=272 /DNA_ID=CAMNT_0016105821 /DNA_START=32 /DNA_END=847 /DNA_ORIENTATION=-
MSKTLSWTFLTQAHMAQVSATNDVAAIKAVLLRADEETKSGYFDGLSAGQREALLDFLYHGLRFARSHAMTAEKQSTLVAIMHRLHSESMRRKAPSRDAFALLEDLLIGHSVHRPPYSAAVFAVDDTKLIIDFLLNTYFRHYKLYLYAFSSRSELAVAAATLGAANETPFEVPPLQSGVPLAQWEAAEAEKAAKAEEERRAAREREEARLAEEEARRRAEAEGPPMPEGLRAQLNAIKAQVAGTGEAQLGDLDARLAAIEARLAAEAAKPSS